MKITSVELQKSSYAQTSPRSSTVRLRPNRLRLANKASERQGIRRYNIYLDGAFAFGADEDLVVDKRLIAGKEITGGDLQKLLEEAELGKLMERLYVLLGRRQRSEKEIKDYLKNLSFKRKVKEETEISELVIDKLIEKLKQKGLVNDLEFAKAWVEGRSKKKGSIALKSELFQKGIGKEIIEEVIFPSGGPQSLVISEKEAAVSLLEKRIERWKNLSKQETKQKAVHFLMRRGFSFDTSKEVIRTILARSGE